MQLFRLICLKYECFKFEVSVLWSHFSKIWEKYYLLCSVGPSVHKYGKEGNGVGRYRASQNHTQCTLPTRFSKISPSLLSICYNRSVFLSPYFMSTISRNHNRTWHFHASLASRPIHLLPHVVSGAAFSHGCMYVISFPALYPCQEIPVLPLYALFSPSCWLLFVFQRVISKPFSYSFLHPSRSHNEPSSIFI